MQMLHHNDLNRYQVFHLRLILQAAVQDMVPWSARMNQVRSQAVHLDTRAVLR